MLGPRAPLKTELTHSLQILHDTKKALPRCMIGRVVHDVGGLCDSVSSGRFLLAPLLLTSNHNHAQH